MQQELAVEHPDLPIEILGVNQIGLETSGTRLGDSGYGVALLQDTIGVNAWELWMTNYRDFFIVDVEGRLVSITQLSPDDEGGGGIVDDLEAYDSVKGALIAAAGGG